MTITGKLLFAAIALLFVCPFNYDVTIVKSDITSYWVGAGRLSFDDTHIMVGSDVSWGYASPSNTYAPVTVFTITTTPFAWCIGFGHASVQSEAAEYVDVASTGVCDVSSEDAYFKSLGY